MARRQRSCSARAQYEADAEQRQPAAAEAAQEWLLQPLHEKVRQRADRRRPAVEGGSAARRDRPPLETRTLRPHLREPIEQHYFADAFGRGNRPELPRTTQKSGPEDSALRGLRLRHLPHMATALWNGLSQREHCALLQQKRLVEEEQLTRDLHNEQATRASDVVEDRKPACRRQRRRAQATSPERSTSKAAKPSTTWRPASRP